MTGTSQSSSAGRLRDASRILLYVLSAVILLAAGSAQARSSYSRTITCPVCGSSYTVYEPWVPCSGQTGMHQTGGVDWEAMWLGGSQCCTEHLYGSFFKTIYENCTYDESGVCTKCGARAPKA
ncbi:MAG: hypothetical protein Q4G19_09370, partial [Clostridia bacterium]|nr:hypothetical protein [Clostridia bacterium]